ncbi:MAG: hypothetical protein AAB521_00295 [Patescibacteria group bacterium]
MTTETRPEANVTEIPYADFEIGMIKDLMPAWDGASQDLGKGLQSHFFYKVGDDVTRITLDFYPHQKDAWLRENPVIATGQRREVLAEDYHHLTEISTVVIYGDEGRVTFFAKDKRSFLEISNGGRALVLQQHRNRTDTTTRINLP